MTNAENNPFWDNEDELLVPENFAVHPGPFLKRHVLNERGVTASALADHLGVARPGLTNMLNGKRALTTALALKIERAIGYPANLLMQMQTNYELAHGREELEPEIEHITRMAVHSKLMAA